MGCLLTEVEMDELAMLIVRDICESDPDSGDPIAKCDCGCEGVADLTPEGCDLIQRIARVSIQAYFEIKASK
jgi:hypothetical protein